MYKFGDWVWYRSWANGEYYIALCLGGHATVEDVYVLGVRCKYNGHNNFTFLIDFDMHSYKILKGPRFFGTRGGWF